MLVGLASCLTAGVAAVAQNRGIQLRSVESNLEGKMDIRGILGIDSDVRNGYDDIKVTFKIDADASKEEIEAHRRAVAEALGGVRRHHQSRERHRRSSLAASSDLSRRAAVAERDHRTGHHGRHRGRACGSCGEPMSHCSLHRSRGARARGGCQFLASRALGLAAAADAQLAEPTARVSVRRRGSGRLHDDARGDRLHLALCRVVGCARAHAHHRHLREANRRGIRRHDDQRASSLPHHRGGERRLQCSERAVARARRVPPSIQCLTPFSYRNPNDLPEGGVLVVGASATGVQLADEIVRSGRPVTLSVGEHVRLPRTYRGRDVLWWMDASGVWNQRYDEIDDLIRVRRLPSPQLIGTPERTTLDLNALSSAGVEIVGRLAAVRDGQALFSGGLRNQFALADLKMNRLLGTFDEWARSHGAGGRGRSCRNASNRHARRLVTTEARSAEWRDPLDHLGDGIPA